MKTKEFVSGSLVNLGEQLTSFIILWDLKKENIISFSHAHNGVEYTGILLFTH